MQELNSLKLVKFKILIKTFKKLFVLIKTMEEKTEKKLPKEWHPQQAKLLKSWAEVASSYRWMHNQSYMIYKNKNLWFMLPLIVMSTVAGTANFAQSTFPETVREYVPQIIGCINLFSAILTTIYQFLKISEFMESHRISSINYGKLARTITIELNLPTKDRNSGGAECVKVSRTEIDRLIEQSPAIPRNVLNLYASQFSGRGLSEPEIVVINRVDIYEDQENKTASAIADASLKFKSLVKKPFTIATGNTNKFVAPTVNKFVAKLSNLISGSPKAREKILPQFEEINSYPLVEETIVNITEGSDLNETVETVIKPETVKTVKTVIKPETVETVETQEKVETVINDTIEQLIEETVQSNLTDEINTLKASRIVSSFKKI